MSGDARAPPECKVTTPAHIAYWVRNFAWVELELDGLPGKAIKMGAKGRFRFFADAAGWLHSIVLHGRVAALGSYSSIDSKSN